MKVLVIGADGQLGFELRYALAPFADVVSLTRADIDLSQPSTVATTLGAHTFDALINAASWNDVDGAERDPSGAMTVNRDSVAEMGSVARQKRAIFFHYSTDFVFDGSSPIPYTERDPACPINRYGESKLAGEVALLATDAPALIFRTAWVYSLRRKSFVSLMLRLAEERTEIRVVQDQFGSPTFCRDLAWVSAMVLFGARDTLYERLVSARGIYHLAGRTDGKGCSRYELARAAIEGDPRRALHKLQHLVPIPSSELVLPAPRPLSTPLDCSKFSAQFGLEMPDWREALRRAMADRATF